MYQLKKKELYFPRHFESRLGRGSRTVWGNTGNPFSFVSKQTCQLALDFSVIFLDFSVISLGFGNPFSFVSKQTCHLALEIISKNMNHEIYIFCEDIKLAIWKYQFRNKLLTGRVGKCHFGWLRDQSSPVGSHRKVSAQFFKMNIFIPGWNTGIYLSSNHSMMHMRYVAA